jgi:transcriptional regulator with XRE-family HTH domain
VLDKKKIANKLVELRGNKSQAEVARDLEISNSAIAMYENGERIPRDDIKLKIANYYKKRIDEIFFL